jgi:hypothetical protein
VRVFTYRSAAEREMVPPPAEAWRWPRQCAAATVSVSLRPDERRVFTLEIPLAELRRDGVAAGTYHLAAVVEPDGRPMRIDLGELRVPR